MTLDEGLQRTLRQHGDGLTRLTRDVGELRHDLDVLSANQQSLDRHLTTLQEDITEHLRRLQRNLSEQIDEAREIVALMRLRLDWVERAVRYAGDLEPVDLDRADPALQHLVVRAERGVQAREALLSDAQRAAHRGVVDTFADLRARYAQQIDAAVRHSRDLAETPYGSAEHDEATATYRSLLDEIATAARELTNLRPQAEDCRRRLAADDELRPLHEPQVTTGDVARSTLNRRLRDRITAAVSGGALLPVWFTTVLGYGPPPSNTGRWLDTAASVLAYRLTYAVTDEVVALGDPPGPGGSGYRQQWYRDLEAALRELRRSL